MSSDQRTGEGWTRCTILVLVGESTISIIAGAATSIDSQFKSCKSGNYVSNSAVDNIRTPQKLLHRIDWEASLK